MRAAQGLLEWSYCDDILKFGELKFPIAKSTKSPKVHRGGDGTSSHMANSRISEYDLFTQLE